MQLLYMYKNCTHHVEQIQKIIPNFDKFFLSENVKCANLAHIRVEWQFQIR
jgi:hypothetical protein